MFRTVQLNTNIAAVSALRACTTKSSSQKKVTTRAEQMNQKMSGGKLGLGELEDIMDMADGGSAVPPFVKDMDIPELTKAFELLGSTNTSMGEMLFVEKYGETLFRQSGWTPMAELINGRCAQIGFVLAILNTFNGDVLTGISSHPISVALTVLAIAGASAVPVVEPKGYFPDALKDGVMGVYKGAKLDEKFTTTAEMVNGRAAMVGMFAFLVTATIF
jgi:surface antigen